MFLNNLTHESHVWYASPESVRDSNTLARFIAMLSSEELQRYERFLFPKDSHTYLVSHALVRRVLSKYADIAPQDWRFMNTQHGRPEIANPGIPSIRFNLTHTAGLAACVITLDQECGIDAEKITKRHSPLDVARKMFSAAEYKHLKTLNGREQLKYFFSRWTLREAYVKAKGIGISFPTRKLTFSVENDDSISVSFHPDIADKNENWKFDLLRPTKQHITAIAISRNDQTEKNVITRFWDI